MTNEAQGEKQVVVRFVEETTVDNGSDLPKGPTYKVGDVRPFGERSAQYWVNRRVAVYATAEEIATLDAPKQRTSGNQGGGNQGTGTGTGTTGGNQGGKGDGVDLDAMTLVQLAEYAAERKIDLGKLTKKADVIDCIRKAEAAQGTTTGGA